MNEESCHIDDKERSCCSNKLVDESNLSKHWDKVYLNTPENKLGWYETDLEPILKLISKTGLNKTARILNIGAGSTRLIDELLKIGHSNLLATDISEVALDNLKNRIASGKLEYIIDDLAKPNKLLNIDKVDLWIDRAVLHFFTDKKDQLVYFDLLKSKVNQNGFVLLAQFSLHGINTCSGLSIHRYSKEMLLERLEDSFDLIDSFDYTYIMPSGAERPYIYTLFRKK